MSNRRFALAALLLILGVYSSGAAVAAEVLVPQAVEIRALLRAHKIDDAVAKGEAWTKASARDAIAWLWAGRAYAQQALQAGLLSKASWASKTRSSYERAVELDGANLEARFDLMQFYAVAPGFLGGGTEKAKAQAQSILDRDPARGHFALGFLADVEQDAASAEREYRQAIALAPGETRARQSLGVLLGKQKRWPEVRAMYIERLETQPNDGVALYQLGRAAALSGEEVEAGLAYLERFLALAEKPEGVSIGGAHWRKGQLLEKLGRREAALAEVRIGAELEPGLDELRKDLKRLGG